VRLSIFSGDHRSLGASGGRRRAGAIAGFAVGAYWLPALAGAWAPLRRPLGIDDRVEGRGGCALTFDDGPHAQGTPAVLEVLARRNARATFFLVGEQVARDPGLAREVAAAGHRVGLHCHRHRNQMWLTPAQVRDDLVRAQALIEDIARAPVELYRPPYGIFNLAALALARRWNWRPLLWTHWGRDWEASATPELVAARLTDRLEPGSVLLLHDADDYGAPGSWRRTADALPRVLDELERRGLAPVFP
jgi:peptidoglycan/xylan/chitin deacetylase (PgdA/CDA1 family)